MKDQKKALALVSANQIQHIDHIAVISSLMGLPIFFLDDEGYQLGKHYYPNLEAFREKDIIITPEFLIDRYDVLFTSELWKREAFDRQFASLETQYGKLLRRVFCPHGFSDKNFYFRECLNEDVCLVYGQNMLDMLEEFHVLDTLSQYVLTGNYRYIFYQQNKKFYQNIVEKEVLSHLNQNNKTILYAPTWQDLQKSSTFFDLYMEILGKLPSDYNLIVKLHPLLEMDDPAAYYSIIGKYDRKGIVFLKDFTPIYPLIEIADIYLGDMSSVGYDFLTSKKPMFFLNKNDKKLEEDKRCFLYQCGVSVRSNEFEKLYQIIDRELKGDQKFLPVREKVYEYTFGKEKPFSVLREEIIRAYSAPRKPTASSKKKGKTT